ncbi:MAG: DUF2442 domain-containing protein [Gemmatimonadaceae bacterium]
MLHVLSVQPVAEYRLRLRFNDGLEGEVDLSDELTGAMFEPLRNIELFRQVNIDPELHTIAWPNGADFAPEFLRNLIGQRSAA